MCVDKQELITAMARVKSLFDAIPYWDNTAKLHGKVVRVVGTARAWHGSGGLQPLLADIQALEVAIRDVHERDPLTQLLQHLTRWREKLEGTREMDPVGS